MTSPDPLDDAALLALGILPEDDARAARARAAADPAFAAEYHDLRAIADAVAFDADSPNFAPSSDASARMKAFVMTAIADANTTRNDAVALNGSASVASFAERAATRSAAREGRRSFSLPAAAVAAALVFAIGAIADDVHQRDVASRAQSVADAALARVANVEERVASDQRALAVVADANARRYAVAQGTVVAAKSGIALVISKLPPPPAGKVYQAWTLTRGQTAMTPSVTFVPDAGGAALVAVPVDATRVAAVAISIEPAGGSAAPTSKPAFVRALS